MNQNDYQAKAMRTLCDQHQARLRASGAAGPENRWLETQAPTYAGGPCESFGDKLPADSRAYNNLIPIQTIHALIGLQGELGELSSVIQKWIWYKKQFILEEVKAKIKDEAGDVLWYVAELLSAFGLSMEEVMTANIAKLAVRYPEKYTDHQCTDENRDRAAEAIAVVGHLPTRNIQSEWGMKDIGPEPGNEYHGHQFIQRDDTTCHHEWMLIQGVAGSGMKCKRCGETKGN